MRRLALMLGTLLPLLTALLIGCQSENRPALTLSIISPHREEIRYEVERAFPRWLARQPQYARWHGLDVQLEWRDIGGGSSAIVRYLRDQYQQNPNGVGIDLLYGGGTDIYFDFKRRGLLEPYRMPPELRAEIPDQLRGVELYDPDGAWHGAMLSSLAILSNREVLDRIGLAGWSPERWADLGDERLLGWIAAGDPRTSGSVHMLYEMILQSREARHRDAALKAASQRGSFIEAIRYLRQSDHLAWGWRDGFGQLLKMGANARHFARFSDAVTKDVVLGRAAAGGSLDSYAYSAVSREQEDLRRGKTRRPVLELVLPRGETILNPDSIGILKGAPHRKLAEAFVEFNLSPDGGQRLWMFRPNTIEGSPQQYSICRLGLAPKLYTDLATYPAAARSVQINPFDDEQLGPLVPYQNSRANARWSALNDLFGAWIVDTHGELSAAWRAVVASRPPGTKCDPLEAELFAPPCPAEELPRIIAELGHGPRQRATLVSRWLDEARARYTRVRAAAEARR